MASYQFEKVIISSTISENLDENQRKIANQLSNLIGKAREANLSLKIPNPNPIDPNMAVLSERIKNMMEGQTNNQKLMLKYIKVMQDKSKNLEFKPYDWETDEEKILNLLYYVTGRARNALISLPKDATYDEHWEILIKKFNPTDEWIKSLEQFKGEDIYQFRQRVSDMVDKLQLKRVTDVHIKDQIKNAFKILNFYGGLQHKILLNMNTESLDFDFESFYDCANNAGRKLNLLKDKPSGGTENNYLIKPDVKPKYV